MNNDWHRASTIADRGDITLYLILGGLIGIVAAPVAIVSSWFF